MTMKKTLTRAARAIFIVAILIWIGLAIELSFNTDSAEIAFGKQLVMWPAIAVVAIGSIISFRDK